MLHTYHYYSLERFEARRELGDDGGSVEEIRSFGGGRGRVDLGEDGGNVTALDDAACAPDLDYVCEIDVPFILRIGFADYTHALHVSSQTSGIDRSSQILYDLFPFAFIFHLNFGGFE